ncbi:MAG: hypothetical protein H0U75_08840 [Legionella sp.]|nr:hypothetical protein [Legionella sp.]
MEFLINHDELEALCGLPHLQQLAYLRGIRPYMDAKAGLVGVKRGISYQSIAEQLYIEPHQGIKSESYSRMQIRRALSALGRAGLISSQSKGLKLILKCELATLGYSVQNKVDLKPTQQLDLSKNSIALENTALFQPQAEKPDTGKTPKADTPLKENYLYLLFLKFWESYPQKKSQHAAWEAFQHLNPDESLCQKMITALKAQIDHRTRLQQHGHWVAAWKHPANWLLQHCWKDELPMDLQQESHNAAHKNTIRKDDVSKPQFWIPEECDTDEPITTEHSNVVAFKTGA